MIGIMTYHFAYNYGAMLQAFALKKVIEREFEDVCIIPYRPYHFKQSYSISPLEKGITLKKRILNAALYNKRKEQIKKFEDFKIQYLYDGKKINEVSSGKDAIASINNSDYDTIVFGSDQIWNTIINKNDPTYFGGGITKKKIAYAASFGTEMLTNYQKEAIKELLCDFSSISLRETTMMGQVSADTKKEVSVVCDPVFLLKQEEWIELFNLEYNDTSKTVVLYLLEDNEEIIRAAYEYAAKHGTRIIRIHPTIALKHLSSNLRLNVGPIDFLQLMFNADAVFTNSFHGVAFSIVFRKKLFHIVNAHSPDRTITLLDRLGVENNDSGRYYIDCNRINNNYLESIINSSKTYLLDSLMKS